MGDVQLQLSSALVLFLTGMVMGGLFDLYRVIRSKAKLTKLKVICGDLLFWVAVAVVVTPLIFWGTWLELRLYVWCLLIAGVSFYFVVFSKTVIGLIVKSWQLISWLPRQLFRLLWLLRLRQRKVQWLIRAKLGKARHATMEDGVDQK